MDVNGDTSRLTYWEACVDPVSTAFGWHQSEHLGCHRVCTKFIRHEDWRRSGNGGWSSMPVNTLDCSYNIGPLGSFDCWWLTTAALLVACHGLGERWPLVLVMSGCVRVPFLLCLMVQDHLPYLPLLQYRV